MRSAGIYRDISCMSGSACCRGSNSIPSHPRRDCPRCWSDRIGLLENRVLAVPQRERKTQSLVVVAEAGEAVLAPVVGARTRLPVREVVPRIAVVAVVLADRAPLALAEIRPPLSPR